MESIAESDSVTTPLEATGSGEPVGPLVIVTVSAIELTCSVHGDVAECPKPSLAVTDNVQVSCVPVALAGAFHVGFWADAFGVKPPTPRPPVQLALHA